MFPQRADLPFKMDSKVQETSGSLLKTANTDGGYSENVDADNGPTGFAAA